MSRCYQGITPAPLERLQHNGRGPWIEGPRTERGSLARIHETPAPCSFPFVSPNRTTQRTGNKHRSNPGRPSSFLADICTPRCDLGEPAPGKRRGLHQTGTRNDAKSREDSYRQGNARLSTACGACRLRLWPSSAPVSTVRRRLRGPNEPPRVEQAPGWFRARVVSRNRAVWAVLCSCQSALSALNPAFWKQK